VLAAEGEACRAGAGVRGTVLLGFPSDVHGFLLLIIPVLRHIPPTALALFLRPGSKCRVGPKTC